MVYFTHYKEYPIYEPAEGGYYYTGNEVVEHERLSLRKAKKKIRELFEEIKWDEEWAISFDKRKVYKRSKYIGEGESYVIERKLGKDKCGYEPYC